MSNFNENQRESEYMQKYCFILMFNKIYLFE